MKTPIAIIPAAGAGARFHELGRSYPKCLLPYGGKPLLEHLVRQVAKDTPIREIYVGIRAADEGHPLFAMVAQLMAAEQVTVNYVVVREEPYTPGPATTLLRCLEVAKPSGGVLLVLSDSLFPGLRLGRFLERNTIAAMPVTDQSRWCMVCRETGRFYDKPKEPVEGAVAVSGVYHFSDGPALQDAAHTVAERSVTDKRETQFSAVMDLYRGLAGRGFEVIPHQREDLVDMGTLEEFLQVKNSCRPREFNTILFHDNVVEKESHHRPNKVLAEASWYQLAPDFAQPYLPKVHSVSTERMSYRMERIYGHNLRHLALYYDKSYDTWVAIFDRVLRFLTHCRCRVKPQAQYPWWAEMLSKTRSRTEGSLERVEQAVLLDEFCRSLEECGAWNQTSFFHGDLHFANMFWSYDSQQLKFVDPRGELYGHWLYDVAKLAHSVYGYYDFIDEKLFVEPDGKPVYYYTGDMQAIRDAFRDTVLRLLTERERKAVRVVCASLFASMVPLHADEHNKQLFLQEYHRILYTSTHEFFR